MSISSSIVNMELRKGGMKDMLKSLMIFLDSRVTIVVLCRKECPLSTYLSLVLAASQTKKLMKNNNCFLKSDGKGEIIYVGGKGSRHCCLICHRGKTDVHMVRSRRITFYHR